MTRLLAVVVSFMVDDQLSSVAAGKDDVSNKVTRLIYTMFQKKTPIHIIGYKLRSSCLILIIFDTNIPHKICHHMTA